MRRRVQQAIDEKLSLGRLDGLEMLTSREVGRILRVSRWVVNRWRRERLGPPFVRIGRTIRYPRWRFDQFVNQRLRQ